MRLTPYWMGKEQIIKPPFRGLMMWLGGLPVDRAKSTNLVAASVEALKAANGPLQLIMLMWLGGLPVDRAKSTNLVAASVEALKAANGPLQLIMPPEGTRGKTRFWKTGFYYIAQGAQVQIVMAYLDYDKKIGGLGPVFQPTGDIDADMAALKSFYVPLKGKNADQFHAA